jgi:predicted phage baseplate assembly protein
LTVQQKCGTEERRKAVKDSSNLNGIDYLEIFTLKQQLNSIYRPLVLVHCLKDIASLELAEKNVRIEGGIRIKDIKVEWLQKAQDLRKKIESHHEDVITKDLTEEERKTIINAIASDPDNTFVIRLSNIGDFSTYTLRLISVRNNSIGDDTDHGGIPSTLENFDTILSKIDFAFRLECRNDIDCIRDVNEWPSESFTEPVIDYMAKDFASFRRLMLDRLSAIMPTWKARNPADLGIVLVELLAYVGDHLSYFQDAVATESYLGTARKRISVKRHARLLDYFLHEGCNARAWVCFELVTNSQSNNDDQGLRIPKKTTLLSGMYLKEGTSSKDQLPSSVLNIGADGVVVNGVENFNNELAAGAEAFETMHEVTIYKQNNSIEFYTWSGTERFIPKGATRATLNADGLDQDILFRWNKIDSVAEDETRLLKFLKNSFNLDWIDKAKIERISAMYFNWNYIPKSPDNDDSDFKHLRQILKEGFQVEWIDDPNVARENENKKIKLSTTNTDEPKVSIELNNEPLKATRATLTIERNNNTPDIRKDEFIVIADNTKGTVKLYDKGQNETLHLFTRKNSLLIELDIHSHKAILKLDDGRTSEFVVKEDNQSSGVDFNVMKLRSLKVCDVLVFEGASSPTDIDPGPSYSHVVRLTAVNLKIDQLTNTPVVDIVWHQEDALPFTLCVADIQEKPVSIAHANVVLVDHGYTVRDKLTKEKQKEKKYLLKLTQGPLTFRAPFNDSTPPNIQGSAFSASNYDVKDVLPDIFLQRYSNFSEIKSEAEKWYPKQDLLESNEFERDFVVELEDDSTAYIRLGKDEEENEVTTTTTGTTTATNNEDQFADKMGFVATYRVGNGVQGNVGAYRISRIAVNLKDDNAIDDKTREFEENLKNGTAIRLYNPMEAEGGINPEELESARLYAPQAFRKQKRAVTTADYVDLLNRHPEIKQSAAIFRWTGSWHTVFISIVRSNSLPVDDKFKEKIRVYLNEYRLAGYDMEIKGPIYVALDIKLIVWVNARYFQSQVKKALSEAFSNTFIQSKAGQKGFFHPDNFTFAQPVYLSDIYKTAMKLEGVESINVERFKRWSQYDSNSKSNFHNGLEEGIIKMSSFEIARLDNDPNFPQNGTIEFVLIGGL